ncbi:MAG TPA: alkaline phosphatase family protein [Thermoleophilaceae bacterium]|nr:alkaline phosphatase family protein [Thermoleophilaceae bacterium]
MRGFAAVLVALLATAAAPAAAATERPIVYVVVIDGLDGDRVDAGMAPFISSLIAGEGGRATYYQESRSVIIAETNPNHVAMMTGAYIESSGTAGNGYGLYAPVEEDTCKTTGPFDYSKPPTLTSGEDASCLMAETVFAAIKRQRNPDRLVTAAVLGKPKLGAIFAGKKVNPKRRDVDHLWSPCSGSLEGDEDYCDDDADTNPASGYTLTDAVVMDEVLRTVEEGVAPAGGGDPRRPDFTFVNLPQVDSGGHAFGPLSAYDAAIGMADTEIRRLVEALRERGEWDRSVVIVLSDHSMDLTPTKTQLGDILEAEGIDESTFTVIGNGNAAMLYLANRTAEDRFDLLKRIRAAALTSPEIAEALYREPNPEDGGAQFTIDGVHPSWHASGERTGDMLVMHTPGGAFLDTGESSNPLTDVAPTFIGQHGASQTRDNFFAVLGGGDHVRRQSIEGSRAPDFDDTLQNPRQAENVDPAPTVMGLFGLDAPEDSNGRFLSEAFDLRALAGRGRPHKPGLRVRRVGGGKGDGCRVRRYRARLKPAGGTFRVRLVSGRRSRILALQTRKTRIRFKVREGRRWRVTGKRRAASGVYSKSTKRRIDLRRAC